MPPFLSGQQDILLDRKASGLYNNIRYFRKTGCVSTPFERYECREWYFSHIFSFPVYMTLKYCALFGRFFGYRGAQMVRIASYFSFCERKNI